MTPVRAVVFDIGETLVDENRLWLAWADWLGIRPLTFLAVLGAVIERGGDHLEPFRILRPDLDLRAAQRERARAGLPNDIRPDDLYPDAIPALEAIRAAGYLVGVAGNQPQAAEALFHGLDVTLDLVASSETLGFEKPDARFFAAIAERLAVTAGRGRLRRGSPGQRHPARGCRRHARDLPPPRPVGMGPGGAGTRCPRRRRRSTT